MHQGRRVLADTLQHVHEVFVRVDVVQPPGSQHALHNADVLGAQLSPAEQPVLFSHWDHPQSAFEVVRVDRYLRVIQIDRQPDPALTDVRQRSEKGAARQSALFVTLRVDPGEEVLEHRFRLFLSACELGLPRQAIVANLLLDLVQSSNGVWCLIGLRWLDIPGVKDLAA